MSDVLVVEDDPDMAAFLARMLENEGMRVMCAADGCRAMAQVGATPPDLVLLDVMLPDASGFAICERLKSSPATAMLPVVLVTALDDHASRVRGIEAGADDFISKPVRREELIARVKTLRRLHQTRRELEARRLAAEVQRKEALRKTFSRYISPRLAERIISDLGEDGAPFGGEPQFPQADASTRAVRAAQDMIVSFAPVLEHWAARGGRPTGIGIGIAAGEAILGNIGSPHYMSHTIIGDAVNTAARLMQMAQAGELLMSDPVHRGAAAALPADRVEPRGNTALRGKSEPIAVYAMRP